MAPKNDQPEPTTPPAATDPNAKPVDPVASAAESLDAAPTSLEPTSVGTEPAKQSIFSNVETVLPDQDEKRPNSIIRAFKRLYKFIFIFMLILIAVFFVIFLIIQKNKNVAPVTAKTQSLSQTTLSELNANSVSIGNSQETLDIESNSIFSGSALVKGALQVAGPLTVAGNTTLQNTTIGGTIQLNQIAGNSLTIDGNTTLKGQLVVGGSLTVAGNSTFSGAVNAGSLTVSTLQVNGNISIDHHLVTNGLSPSIKSVSSLGSGGTTSINGTDTAGTIIFNFGSGASGNVCDAVSFNQVFATVPTVVVSPSNSGAADNTNYYVTSKTVSGFEICLNVPTDSNANFDYFVID
jgi:cytoskeletal protein CcmA (bactofilin family)